MKRLAIVAAVLGCLLMGQAAWAEEPPVSAATTECLGCHETVSPGIVADWRASRHAAVTPAAALAVPGLGRKVSADNVPDDLKGTVVGCAECHTMAPGSHPDTFDHLGRQVHIVVTPKDCAACHSTEATQFDKNLMAHAYGNLDHNTLYQQLVTASIGTMSLAKGKLAVGEPSAAAKADSCSYCHGTKLEVTGKVSRDTDMGPMEFPVLAGWPNQGVGRVNTDGSLGSCAACHARHGFSMAVARMPHTCKDCHDSPEVPAYRIFNTSKHGNLYTSLKGKWDFTGTPWTVGKDFTAPTCAVCHMSLVVAPDGTVLAERSHEVKNRLPWRIFGLIYAHPQPKSPDTSVIRSPGGLPLPTDLDGTLAASFLIDKPEMEARRGQLQKICAACHATSWIAGHWSQFEAAIAGSDATVKAGTEIMQALWKAGYGTPPGQGNPFDSYAANVWGETWLFSANSIRFASAMAGGGDYGAFADGRYQLGKAVRELSHWLQVYGRGKK